MEGKSEIQRKKETEHDWQNEKKERTLKPTERQLNSKKISLLPKMKCIIDWKKRKKEKKDFDFKNLSLGWDSFNAVELSLFLSVFNLFSSTLINFIFLFFFIVLKKMAVMHVLFVFFVQFAWHKCYYLLYSVMLYDTERMLLLFLSKIHLQGWIWVWRT